MKFIKTHWFSILLIGILVFVLLRTQKQNEELVKQVKGLETLNENLVEQSNIYLNLFYLYYTRLRLYKGLNHLNSTMGFFRCMEC